MGKEILYVKSHWLNNKLDLTNVDVVNKFSFDLFGLFLCNKYEFLFVNDEDKKKLIQKGKSKYKVFSNNIESNLNLYLKTNKKKLTNSDFTIISSDCWGSYIYTYLNINYKTPTVWLTIENYVKFCEYFSDYIKTKLQFIETDKNYPVAKLEDVNIHFMHYKTNEDAKYNWEKRVERINYNKLFFRFATDKIEEAIKFCKINQKNKVCFFDARFLNDEKIESDAFLPFYYPDNGRYLSFGQYAQLECWQYFDIIEWLNSGKVIKKL